MTRPALLIYCIFFGLGLLLCIGLTTGWLNTSLPHGAPVLVIVFAAAWLIVRYVVARRHFPGGWRGKRQDDSGQKDNSAKDDSK